MPIPSPAPYRRSNLTKQQKKDELEAIYGVTMSQITDEEIQKMREMIANHDAETSEEVDFDPSKVKVPYRFQKFPMVVYNHARSRAACDEERNVLRGSLVVAEVVHVKAHLASMLVQHQQELDAALSAGWSEAPPEFKEEQEDEPSVDEQAVAVRRGRPRNNAA